MKNHFFLLLLFVLVAAACTKNTVPVTTDDPVLPPLDTTISQVKYTGTFQKGPWGTVSGTAKVVIINGKLQLRLEGFNSTSGPDLYVYISRELEPLNFLRLGKLKALSGDQLYDINGNPNFMEYPYVLVHCEKFNHLFGSALLMKL